MVSRTADESPAHFILVCVDASDIEDHAVKALDIAMMRLRSSTWPLYKGTGHTNKLQPGDRCLIYIGGQGPNAQSFLGTAVVDSIAVAPRGWIEADGEVMTDPATNLIHFSNVEVWDLPISIRPLIERLKFVRNKKRWGLHMMGGVKQLPESDFELICRPEKASDPSKSL